MTIIRRGVALLGLAAVLVACGEDADENDADSYRELTPAEVCELVTLDEARDLMEGIADEPLTAGEETMVNLPVCRYGSGDGKPYLTVSIYKSSQVDDADKVDVTVADHEALQQDSDGSCSVFVPLVDDLYLLAIVESWDPSKDTCPVAREALQKAVPRLIG